MNKYKNTIQLIHECPVCTCSIGHIIGNIKYSLFKPHKIQDCYVIVNCAKCGFVTSNINARQEDYNEFYKESFYNDNYLDRDLDSTSLLYVNHTIDVLTPYLKDKYTRIFDIGCGTGLLLNKLYDSGYKNIYGTDPSESCIDNLNKQNKFQVKSGSVFNIPFPNIEADIIILSHVIEHIIDLQSTLENIYNKLSDDGIVYVEVPDASRYDIIKDGSPIRFFYFQHLIHFDHIHLKNLFNIHGFKEIKSGKKIRIERNLLIPCIWKIFTKKKVNRNSLFKYLGYTWIKRDFNLSNKINKWFENISLDTDNILSDLAISKSQTYIWGLGTHCQFMLGMSPLNECNIKCYIDNNKQIQEKTINGCKIYSSNILKDATEKDTVFIGAPTHSKQMIEYIKEINFKGKIIVCDFEKVHIEQDV